MQHIKSYKGKYIYEEINGPKIALTKGRVAFMDSVYHLNTLSPIHPLSLSQELTILINEEEEEEKEKLLDKKYMSEAIFNLKKLIKVKNISFHYDYGSSNPEISGVIQVVDDNNSNFFRRNNILNPKFNFVGISISQIRKKKFLVYCTFC
jgi:hypothetical protein